MVIFLLGVSICLNIVFIALFLFYMNLKKSTQHLKDVVEDFDSFKSFFN